MAWSQAAREAAAETRRATAQGKQRVAYHVPTGKTAKQMAGSPTHSAAISGLPSILLGTLAGFAGYAFKHFRGS